MSFKTKLSITFVLVLMLTVIVSIISWWGMKEALKSQKNMYVFQHQIEQTFHELSMEEKTFSAEETIQQSRRVYEHILAMQKQMRHAKNDRLDTQLQQQLAVILASLGQYHANFTKYVEYTLDLQTILSRMEKEASLLRKRVDELSEQAIPSILIFNLATDALIAQKNFIIFPHTKTYNNVKKAVGETLDILSQVRKQNHTIGVELPLYRVAKSATSFSEVFEELADQYKNVDNAQQELRHTFLNLRDQVNSSIKIETQLKNEQIYFFQSLIVTTAILAILFCVCATLILSDYIIRPIEMLKKSATKIVNGDLSSSVDITSRDEIGELGQLFNEMTTKLRISFQELEKYKEKLEHLVQERTHELEMEISERREAVKELIASEKKFRAFFENSTDGILIANPRTKSFISANQTICNMLGYTEREILQLNVESIHPPDSRNLAVSDFEKMARGQQKTTKEIPVLRKDGSTFPVEITSAQIELSNQAYLLGSFRDISERKAVEAERLKVNKLESVGILAGGIAHDFNNILSAILGNVSLALALTESQDKRFTLLTELEKASVRAKDLTQQLLTFSKGGEPVKEISQVTDIIRESATFILRGSNVRCDFQFSDDLWGAEVDPGQISQVIQNIVVNAKQAMVNGGIITIHCQNTVPIQPAVGTLYNQKCLEISITDTGQGMPGHLLEHVFDPYFTTKKEGSGLGLAITHSIISKHNGTISASSEAGCGTTFTILLPAVDLTHPLSSPDEVLQSEVSSATVMVMDDEKPLRDIAEQLLLHLGYSVITAPDGVTAISVYQSRMQKGEPVDIVIMDLTIPGGMGGEEAASKILKINPHANLIVSSGYSHDPIMANYAQFGFKGFLCKPYNIQDLQGVIHEVLAQ